jgi:hypothetical protein
LRAFYSFLEITVIAIATIGIVPHAICSKNCHVIRAGLADAFTALNAFVIGITLTDATNCLNRI